MNLNKNYYFVTNVYSKKQFIMRKHIKLIIFLSLITLFLTCEEAKKTSSEINDNNELLNPKTTISSLNNFEYNKITGAGNEPGWNIEITKINKTEFTFKMNTLLQEKNVTGTLGNIKIEKDNQSFKMEGKDYDNNKIKISYLEEECLDMAANKYKGTMHIVWKKNILKGCSRLYKE